MRTILGMGLLVLAVAVATPAMADDFASQRDIETAVDSYLATSGDDASLVGGPGSAGYDAGFWIRGGDFLLRINATLQARFESWNWDDEDDARRFSGEPFAGDLSGFSLPRATLKLSGEAPCNICWYIELEFGHFGRNVVDEPFDFEPTPMFPETPPRRPVFQRLGGENLGGSDQSDNFDNTREAWIEWCYCPSFNVRMGQVKTPGPRQLMVAPELQQFIDISMASAWVGVGMPGYTDRNRDHGLLFHGAFGCNNEWSYLVSITNGDGGDSIRNVLDHRTSDNLAYAARLNWAFLAPIGYEEGALRQQTCQWYGELGAWAHFYADRTDKPHTNMGDHLNAGIDLALGYGGFSFTGGFSIEEVTDADFIDDFSSTSWLIQLGYHFPGTAWEIAARASSIDYEDDDLGTDGATIEYAFAINYYLNGHGNKLQLDLSFFDATDDGYGVFDVYAGMNNTLNNENSAIMFRFQWQLAL